MNNKKTILVTGGCGYVGSQVCKALRRAGYRPVAVDNLSKGHRHFAKWGPLVKGDCGDPLLLTQLFTSYQPSAVIHCAALTDVRESLSKPELYHQNNVTQTEVLLEQMVIHNIPRLLFASTCAVYETGSTAPLGEETPLAPLSPYGETKKEGEALIASRAKTSPLKYGILRYFNVAGADLEGEIGEWHDPETHLIPILLEAAVGRRSAFTLFGTDFPTPDGSAVRDYVHVHDIADAHVRALKHLESGGESFTVNLGSGEGISVRELIAAVEQLGGKPFRVIEGERRAGDAPSLIADNRRAKELLGWRPTHSSVEQIVQTAWEWMHSEVVGLGELLPAEAGAP